MSGFVHIGDDLGDYESATAEARIACESACFFLSIKTWDTERSEHDAESFFKVYNLTFIVVCDPDHLAMVTGSFSCGSLPGSPYMIRRGKFRLFSSDPAMVNTTDMKYDFDMLGTGNERVHFHAIKILNPSVAFDPLRLWRATSTLYVTLTRPDGSVLGRGTLNIRPRDFASELKTLKPTGSSLSAKVASAAEFLGYFVKESSRKFFTPFTPLQWPTSQTIDTPSKLAPTTTIEVLASDGVRSIMQMWDPTSTNPSDKVMSVLLIPGAAVDHQIFALPTIEHTAVDFFRDAGYRVFCVTLRIGKTAAAQKGYTAFDARLDVAAALQSIRETRPLEKVYVVAHCVGSLAFSMGLLDGSIPVGWIGGITASNVFMNLKLARVNEIKANLPLPLNKLYRALAGSWFSCSSSPSDTLVQRLLNQSLRFYPVGSRAELCSSVVCHRGELVFGRYRQNSYSDIHVHHKVKKYTTLTFHQAMEPPKPQRSHPQPARALPRRRAHVVPHPSHGYEPRRLGANEPALQRQSRHGRERRSVEGHPHFAVLWRGERRLLARIDRPLAGCVARDGSRRLL